MFYEKLLLFMFYEKVLYLNTYLIFIDRLV